MIKKLFKNDKFVQNEIDQMKCEIIFFPKMFAMACIAVFPF